jgi:hypothetical protein
MRTPRSALAVGRQQEIIDRTLMQAPMARSIELLEIRVALVVRAEIACRNAV